MPEQVKSQLIEDEMQQSYMDYAMSVIVSRALPDVRDGLKPVHRRILYAMNKLGLLHNKAFRKSAHVVGSVLASYHPHGDVAVYDSLVRMAQDFSLRYPLIKGQGNWGCFTKDTKVSLTDDRNLSFRGLIKEYKQGKKNYTYTVNKDGDVEIAEIKKPRLTKKNQKIVKIILDNNEEIKCTLNHKFMLRDGTYKEARVLKSGDSLMPLYLKLSTAKDKFKPALHDYQMVYQPRTNKWVPCHNLADNWNLKNDVYIKSSGRIRHHLDFNKLNNNPYNVRRIKWKEHWELHAEHASKLHEDENYRKKIAAGRKKYWADSKNREAASRRLSERNRKNWKDLAYRKQMSEFLSKINKEYIRKHPEKREELSKRATKTLKKLWEDPKYRKMKSDSLKEKWKDPEYYNQQSKRMKEISIKLWSDPIHKKYISNLGKKRWKNDSRFREYFLKILSDNGKKANYYRFLTVCKKAIKLYGDLSKENYERVRISYNSRNGAGIIKFEIALEKFFNNKIDKLYKKLGVNIIKLNHKVKNIVFLKEKQDVYDLTIENTHNFALASGVFVHNSIDGHPAAAMRYTECKLNKIAEEILNDIDKDTVDFVDNYDNSTKEPTVLPSRIPNLLVNGSSGIAVGMATNIPPHNMDEVVNALVAMIDNKDISIEELMKYIQGPDFPTGALICGRKGIVDAYNTGRGKVSVKARCNVEVGKIIIEEIPYMVNKSLLLESIAELVKSKKVEGIRDLRDESDREGLRIVIELKKGANAEYILNNLMKQTQLLTTFGVIMLALVNGEPKVLNLKQLLENYLLHRKLVVERRSKFELNKAEDRAHILVGLQKALKFIDPVVKTIKGSENAEIALRNLTEKFKLTEKQGKAILEMKLQRLTSLETQKVQDEYDKLVKLIGKLKEILSSDVNIMKVVRNELLEVKKEYTDVRRTEITEEEEELEDEDLVKEEDVAIMVTNQGYIKQTPLSLYKKQRRGGKGIIGTETKEEDVVEELFITSNLNYLLFFTNKGKVYWLKAYNVPVSSRYSKGKAIVNLLHLDEDEKVNAVLPVKKFDDKHYLLFATKNGVLKKTALSEYSNPRKKGIIAITLKNDEVVKVRLTPGDLELMLCTKKGQAVRFSEKDVRSMGRAATGVRGVKLKKGDEVVGMEVAFDQASLLTVTEKGYGKRTSIKEYKKIRRGGKGVRNIKISSKNGDVVGVKTVMDHDELMFISEKGVVIRVEAKDISVIGRATQGVRVMRLKTGDKLISVARVVKK